MEKMGTEKISLKKINLGEGEKPQLPISKR